MTAAWHYSTVGSIQRPHLPYHIKGDLGKLLEFSTKIILCYFELSLKPRISFFSQMLNPVSPSLSRVEY